MIGLKLKGLSKAQSAALLFFCGLLLGVLFANLFKGHYISEMRVLEYSYHMILKDQQLDYIGLLKYTLLDHSKEFVLYWLFCFTLLGIPWIIVTLVWKGIQVGFLLSSVIILYRSKGILLFFSYIMPQAIIYIPVLLICLQKGYQLAQYSYHRSKNQTEWKRSVFLGYLAIIFILYSMLIIGAVIETYFGSAFLKKTLGLCV